MHVFYALSVSYFLRRKTSFEDNIAALSFDIPAELRARLDAASAPERPFPYVFFTDELQGMIHGGATVGAKPPGYYPAVEISGGGAGVTS